MRHAPLRGLTGSVEKLMEQIAATPLNKGARCEKRERPKVSER